jgi:pimeloyl-ACP methyl ester carboxylesterase
MGWDGIEIVKLAANGIEFEISTLGEGDRLALCLHGFPELAYSWRFQMPLLAKLGYRVWAPNLRGYGGTTSPPAVEAYKPTTLVADVLALIEAAGARETVLIGHDWGAILAWMIALDHPDRISRLVILNVPHPARFDAEFWRTGQFLRSWYMLFFQLPGLPEFVLGRAGAKAIGNAFRNGTKHLEHFTDADMAVYEQNALRPGGLTAMLNWYRALFRYRPKRSQYPIIETPTLMIWGDADFALDIRTALGTEIHIRDLTFRRLEGISHWAQQEAPEEVNALLEAWLTGAPVPEFGEIRVPGH